MSQTDSLLNMYTKLHEASADRERLYSAKGIIDWAMFAANPNGHRAKAVELRQKDFAFGTLRITEPCLLRLTENIDFNPNAPLTWLDDNTQPFPAAWDSEAFSEAIGIDPQRTSDWLPNRHYITDHVLPDGTTIPAWGDNMAHYLTGDVARAYRLGFFAAIAVEADGVIIDLNGFSLRQHAMHALMQRFFALIELGDQPFPPGQGPATDGGFGTELQLAHQVTITNGTLGRSSHHAIHGNNCRDVLIEGVTFVGHEVAAISLNGAQRVAIVNCESLGSRQPSNDSENRSQEGVPVLGTFSASRFALGTAQNILAHADSSTTWGSDVQHAKTGFQTAFHALHTSVNMAFNEVIFQGLPTPSDPLFQNRRGLTDGPSYGVLCSPPGVAVGPFMEAQTRSTPLVARDYYLHHVSMRAIAIAPREIISISGGKNQGNQVDIAGAVLQLFGLEGQPGCRAGNGTYAGTVLSHMQIRLAQAKRMLIDHPAFQHAFGTLSIEEPIVAWALAGHDPNYANPFPHGTPPYKLAYKLESTGGGLDLQDSTGKPMGYSVRLRCNGDSMHHVHKGTVAYRFDGISGLSMNQCSATEISNKGPAGSLLGGQYKNGSDGGHEEQGDTLVGYTGSDTYGIRLSACEHVTLTECRVGSVVSNQGSGYGLYVSNGSRNILLNGCVIDSVKAGMETHSEEPWQGANTIPQAFSLKTDSDTSAVVIEHCTADGESQPTFPEPSH